MSIKKGVFRCIHLYLLFLASLKIAIGLLGGFLLLCFGVVVFLIYQSINKGGHAGMDRLLNQGEL